MTGRKALARRLGGARDGAAAVEMALVLPVLLLLVLGTMEVGRMAFTQAALTFAVQEAARCASVRPDLCGSPTQTAAYAAQRIVGRPAPASAFSVSNEPCGVRVSARLPFSFVLTPLIPAAPVLTAQVCRP